MVTHDYYVTSVHCLQYGGIVLTTYDVIHNNWQTRGGFGDTKWWYYNLGLDGVGWGMLWWFYFWVLSIGMSCSVIKEP